MILEHAEIWIEPEKKEEFEAAIVRGLRTIVARAEGMLKYKVHRCIETPGRYVMQICWTSVEHHMVGYRQGPLSPEFRALITPFFSQPPVMAHFEQLVEASGIAEGP